MSLLLRSGVLAALLTASIGRAQVGYLGPAGSWTHQACMDLYGEAALAPLARERLFAAFADREIEKLCIPVTTSAVGVTPYLDDVLAMKGATIVAEYPKMLGYSLLVKPGAALEQVRIVLAHPVALEEVKPWLDKHLHGAVRKAAASAGAAAQEVAMSNASDIAAFGPAVGARLYGLVPLLSGIEEGPHNVTRWWVMGREMPAPTGHDKTTLLLSTSERSFGRALRALGTLASRVLTIYERPSKKTLDGHSYVVEVSGHATQAPLKQFLQKHAEFRVLGSYPRKY